MSSLPAAAALMNVQLLSNSFYTGIKIAFVYLANMFFLLASAIISFLTKMNDEIKELDACVSLEGVFLVVTAFDFIWRKKARCHVGFALRTLALVLELYFALCT